MAETYKHPKRHQRGSREARIRVLGRLIFMLYDFQRYLCEKKKLRMLVKLSPAQILSFLWQLSSSSCIRLSYYLEIRALKIPRTSQKYSCLSLQRPGITTFSPIQPPEIRLDGQLLPSSIHSARCKSPHGPTP